MTDADHPLVRHEHLLPDEGWDDAHRGGATWRTLFSRDVTPTTALSTGISSVPPGGELACHRHQTVESYYVVQGVGLLRLGDTEHEVRAGSAVHIPSLTRHGLRNTGEDVLRFFYVFAADRFADVVYDFGTAADEGHG